MTYSLTDHLDCLKAMGADDAMLATIKPGLAMEVSMNQARSAGISANSFNGQHAAEPTGIAHGGVATSDPGTRTH